MAMSPDQAALALVPTATAPVAFAVAEFPQTKLPEELTTDVVHVTSAA